MAMPHHSASPGARVIEHGALRIETGPERETCLVELFGELDLESAAVLEHELLRLVESSLRTVVVDLHELEFIDSTGLRCLASVTRHSRLGADNVRFTAPSVEVEHVLSLTGLREVLPFLD
jgi:anti-anti-sigma factor